MIMTITMVGDDDDYDDYDNGDDDGDDDDDGKTMVVKFYLTGKTGERREERKVRS